MKKPIFIIIILCLTVILHGQVSKTINVTSGGLSIALTASEKNTITNLTLTGTIDARDFKTMRDSMNLLAVLDISGTTIAAYYGIDGTVAYINGSYIYGTYLANEVPYNAFWNPDTGIGKTRLLSIKLPLSATSLQGWAFAGCTGLTSVTIPSMVTFISGFVFKNCTGLNSITIPPSVTYFNIGAFMNCSGLKSITIPSTFTTLSSDVFAGCSGINLITIPLSVASIDSSAFLNCSGLTSITIPSSVTSIGSKAFFGCSNLKSIYSNGETPVDLSSSMEVFEHIDKTACTLHVPYGASVLYAAADQWKNFTNIVEIPGFKLSSVNQVIGSAAGSTTSIDISSTVTWTASSDQTWLIVNPTTGTGTKLTLTFTTEANPSVARRAATITVSSPGLVSQTIKITQAGLLKTLEITAGGLFSALTADDRSTITRLKLTGTIDARDFKIMRDNMPSLVELDVSGTVVAAYNGPDGTVFYNYDYRANAVPDYAFYNYLTGFSSKVWTSIILPLSVNSLGIQSFYGCYGLTSFTIPSLVTSIGKSEFFDCEGLKSIKIPSSVTTIEDNAFDYCKGLTSIEIPSSATSIGKFAFRCCGELKTITIPISICSLGDNAFDRCTGLNSIYAYGVSPLDLSSSINVFEDVNKGTCTLHVPFGTSALYAAANQWKDFLNIVEMPGFMLSQTTLQVPATGSIASIAISSDVTWAAGSNQSWLTISPTSYSGNNTLAITTAANPTFATRTAIVTISSPGVVSQTTKITQAGLLKTMEITACGLFSALTADERSTITRLKITGTIDDRDFKTMRDEMPALAELDISGATVTAYNGPDGTYPYKHDYLANVFPEGAFFTLITGTGKTSLTSVILPSSVNSIGDNAFYGCSGLTSVTIPSSVNSIGMFAFDGCSNLTSLAIPPSVISIGMYAFEKCSGLTSVAIPASATSIGQAAFFGCSGLNSIYANEVIPVDLNSSIGVFYGVNKNTCILHVPYSTSGLYAAANQWKDFTNIVEMPGFKLSSFNKVIEAAPGSTGSIEINSDVTWTASSDQTWLTVIPITGTGTKQTLTFTAQANTSTTDQRVAKITISATDQIAQTITVTQKITIDPTKLDAFEPDNSLDKAGIIKSGDIQQHNIYPFEDIDYASFDLTNAPAQVEVKFNTISSGHQIQLLATDGSTVLSTDNTIINTKLTKNGKYYIKAWNPDNLLIPNYQLCLKIKPVVVDRYEPDNTWQEAKLIVPFTEQDDHTIKTIGDLDYVKFTISDAPRTIYVDVTDNRKECKTFGVWLYGTNGTTILNYSNAPRFNCGAYMEYTLTANGTYFLKVGLPQGESGTTRDDYTIKLTTNGIAPPIKCDPADSLALVAIYNIMNGANWNRKQNWLTGKVQNWQGVTLSSEGRVTKLNLTTNNLKGSIPTEIGQLTALRILNLGNTMYVEIGGEPNNLMSSTLPLSMANLVNLEVLSLDGLCFNSELTDVFSGMAKLRELYLNQNGFNNNQLPIGILSCSKLEKLGIENNSFSQLPDVTGLTNLQNFTAYSNLFTFEDLEPNWTISGFNYSPQHLVGQSLALNPIVGTLVTHKIEIGGAHNIYQWYKNDVPIPGQTSNTLRIENVSKSDAGLYHLRVTNSLATQLTLYSETLTLYQNELPIYKALEAFYNSTGGENWTNKTNWLSNEPLTAWQGIYENEYGQYRLSFDSNNLIGQLPANMGDLTIFTSISIYLNPQLTGSIPASIGNLDRLQELSLTGSLNGEIPSSIGNLKNLETLFLNGNQFSGSVPASIVNCSNLTIVALNDNNLENLPNLSAMSKLVVMYLYNNKFEFDDLMPARLGNLNLYGYVPQQKFGKEEVYNKRSGELLTLTASAGGTGNLYHWYKDGNPLNGKTTNTFIFTSLAITDQGSYTCNVTNPSVPNLTLESKAMSVVVNRALVANAGSDQSINELSVVTLDGSASSDPDGNPLTFKWSAPVGITLSSGTAAKPTFTAPEVTVDTSYTISLVVNNGKVDSPADQVKITIKQVNKVPVANAGADQSVNERATVTLNGSASTDADGNSLTYKWSVPAGITLSSTTVAKPTFTAPEVTVNTSYTISLVVNDGFVDSPADQVIITVKNVVPIVHFSPVWTGNGVDHMNINLVSAKLDAVELEAGDEIGIFDGAICVGAGTVTGTLLQSNTLDIVVSLNDGSGNGFTSGDVISYQLFDKSKDLEISNLKAVYSNTDPSWSTNGKFLIGATAFVELTGLSKVKQMIGLSAGWNIVSANVISVNLNLKDIFQPLIDAGKLQKVMDETGKTIENFGTFGGWKNNIGNLNSTKGYKVKVMETSSLSLDGTSIRLPLDINLIAGWNIISYPCAGLQDAKALVQPLIDAGKLKKVMDEAGKTIEDYGAFGGWKNSIGNFVPGKGFKVNVTGNCTLTISAKTTKAATLNPEVLTSTHFSRVYSGNGSDHMNINLVDLSTSGLMAGDEIGVFDGKYCVGSVAIGTDQMISGSVSIPASSNDALTGTVDGFTSGHPVALQLYRGNETYELKTIILNGVNSFEKNGSLFVKATASEIPVLQIKDESDQFRCYPNPFAGEITIDIQNSLKTNVTLSIYNLMGQQIKTLFKGTNKGQMRLKWDGTDDSGQLVVPGVYLCKVNDRTIKVVFTGGM